MACYTHTKSIKLLHVKSRGIAVFSKRGNICSDSICTSLQSFGQWARSAHSLADYEGCTERSHGTHDDDVSLSTSLSNPKMTEVHWPEVAWCWVLRSCLNDGVCPYCYSNSQGFGRCIFLFVLVAIDVTEGFYEVSSNHALAIHFSQFITLGTLAASQLDTFCTMYLNISQNFARLRM